MDFRIEVRRVCAKLGPAKVARELGVDRSTVWRWETGRARPSRMAQRFLRDMVRRKQPE